MPSSQEVPVYLIDGRMIASVLLLVMSGEALVGPKSTFFMDEISTGLDSSTTFLITKALRNFAHLSKAPILVALLQPQPETYVCPPSPSCPALRFQYLHTDTCNPRCMLSQP